MAARLIRVGWALVLAQLIFKSLCLAEPLPSLIEISAANFTETLNLMNEYDWTVMEFYAHW